MEFRNDNSQKLTTDSSLALAYSQCIYFVIDTRSCLEFQNDDSQTFLSSFVVSDGTKLWRQCKVRIFYIDLTVPVLRVCFKTT